MGIQFIVPCTSNSPYLFPLLFKSLSTIQPQNTVSPADMTHVVECNIHPLVLTPHTLKLNHWPWMNLIRINVTPSVHGQHVARLWTNHESQQPEVIRSMYSEIWIMFCHFEICNADRTTVYYIIILIILNNLNKASL